MCGAPYGQVSEERVNRRTVLDHFRVQDQAVSANGQLSVVAASGSVARTPSASCAAHRLRSR